MGSRESSLFTVPCWGLMHYDCEILLFRHKVDFFAHMNQTLAVFSVPGKVSSGVFVAGSSLKPRRLHGPQKSDV